MGPAGQHDRSSRLPAICRNPKASHYLPRPSAWLIFGHEASSYRYGIVLVQVPSRHQAPSLLVFDIESVYGRYNCLVIFSCCYTLRFTSCSRLTPSTFCNLQKCKIEI